MVFRASPAGLMAIISPVVIIILAMVFSVPEGAIAETGPVPDRVVIDLPEEITPEWVPLGGAYDIYALVFDASGRDITDEAEAEWWITPDIASWTYISTVGMRLFPEAIGVLTVHTRAWVGGANVTTSIDLTLVITIDTTRINRLPATGYVYPGDALDLQLELLDTSGYTIAGDISCEWNTTSGTIDEKVDPACVSWTAGPEGTAVISVLYTLMEQSGSATLTVDVVSRVTAIIIDDVPEEKYSGVYFEFHVAILDGQGRDVTKEATVRPAVWIDEQMTAIDWKWNSSSGYMGIKTTRWGNATVSVRAELNGINLSVGEDIEILEGISPEGPEVYESPILEMHPGYMIAILVIAVATMTLVLWRRSRRNPFNMSSFKTPLLPDLDDDEDDYEVMSHLDSKLLEHREGEE